MLDLAAGLSASVGSAFFSNYVKYLARIFEADFVLVTELLTSQLGLGVAKTLGFWAQNNAADNFQYTIEGTPCECVYHSGETFIADKLQEKFPNDKDLVQMGVTSYYGMPLLNDKEEAIGHVCLLSKKQIEVSEMYRSYLKIFASRASAELQRIKAERQLLDHRNNLQGLVAERTRELELALKEAKRANQVKTDFLSRMSHELRTPLNAVVGFSELLLDSTEESLKEEEFSALKDIHNAGIFLSSLVDDLLDYTLLCEHRLKVVLQPLDVSQVIVDSCSLISGLAKDKKISINVTNRTGGQCKALADDIRLKQCIVNMLSNAIKFSKEGQHIDIELETRLNSVNISVVDHGCGISDVNLGKIFNEFERLDSSEKCISGTGIGLSLTKQLVEFMNGSIGVESILGIGSVFWIELPTVR
ncbi:MAG: HAMP domain-containing histidine kinase [Gammaproteobacteria bacterium]|nr:HAMP domain-containing histidine kinase [Gammaproteobacteria bacterium]